MAQGNAIPLAGGEDDGALSSAGAGTGDAGNGGGRAGDAKWPGPWQRVWREFYLSRWLMLPFLLSAVLFAASRWEIGLIFLFAMMLPDLAKLWIASPAMLYWHGTARPPAAGFVYSWRSTTDGRGEILTVDVNSLSRGLSLFIWLSGLAPVLILLPVVVWTEKGFGFIPFLLTAYLVIMSVMRYPNKLADITLDFSRGLIYVQPQTFPRWFSTHVFVPRTYPLSDIVRFENEPFGVTSKFLRIEQAAHLSMVTQNGKTDSLHTFMDEGSDPTRIQDLAEWLTAQLDARRATIPQVGKEGLEINELEVELSFKEYLKKSHVKLGEPELEYLEVLRLRISESKKAGRDIGWDDALQLWIRDHRDAWRSKHPQKKEWI